MVLRALNLRSGMEARHRPALNRQCVKPGLPDVARVRVLWPLLGGTQALLEGSCVLSAVAVAKAPASCVAGTVGQWGIPGLKGHHRQPVFTCIPEQGSSP